MILLVHCGKLNTAQHEKIRSAIDSDPRITDWRHVLESSWLVETRDHNTSALRDMIREESGGCSVIVIPVSTYTGYLDKAVWEWLEKKDLSDAPKPPQNKPQAAEDNDAVRDLREITDAPDIDSFIGMDDAVAQLRRQIGGIAFRRNAGDIGLKLKQGFSNMLLMGPPGVGKTSLALCAAMMLKDNLPGGSKKRVFLVQAADLIDRHVGKSTNNTKAVLQAAGDGVIVFDEIDTLMDVAHYGEEVLNTLNTHIGNAPNHPVIVATIYGKREHEFRSANPGLSSRLPHTQRLPSYDDKTLTAIFMRLAADAGLTVTPQAGRWARISATRGKSTIYLKPSSTLSARVT